jgi:ribokinase
MSGDRLLVLGAVNVDLVVVGVPLPAAGQTVVGGTFERHDGGKGANQAVAAARALRGSDHEGAVQFIGAVGEDAFGAEARAVLEAERIDLAHLAAAVRTATGVALIVVDGAGENQIAVAPGANHAVTEPQVDAALEAAPVGSLLLASLEVPLGIVRHAAERSRELGIGLVLNPAPATAEAVELVPFASVLTPNEGELEELRSGGAELEDVEVVVTLGSKGAEILSTATTIPAPSVDAVDATGAGDCFNGVLAASLFEGRPLEEAVRRAVAAAAISVSVAGAREGIPTRDRLERALADTP